MTFLSADEAVSIISEAKKILVEIGVEVSHPEIVDTLAGRGARIDGETNRIHFTHAMIEEALKQVPTSVELFDVLGTQTHQLGGRNVHFTPGSSALRILDAESKSSRTPTTADYISYVKVVTQLQGVAAQSTAFIPGDVPEQIGDSYRLFLSLLYGRKPVMTGIFETAAFGIMRDLLLAVRGTGSALRQKPLAIFSCCPTSPLSWTKTSAQCIWDCADLGIPVELVPMPLSGFTSPVTLFGTLIQHAAENISGVVISQVRRPGAPVLYGGSA